MSVEEAAIKARQAIVDQSAKLQERIDNPQDGKFLSSDEAYYASQQLLHMFATTILSSQLFHINKNLYDVLLKLADYYKTNIQRLEDEIEKDRIKFETRNNDYWLHSKNRRVKEKELIENQLAHLIEGIAKVMYFDVLPAHIEKNNE